MEANGNFMYTELWRRLVLFPPATRSANIQRVKDVHTNTSPFCEIISQIYGGSYQHNFYLGQNLKKKKKYFRGF